MNIHADIESFRINKKNFKVKLIHIEEIFVEAENEDEAFYKADAQAEHNCVWSGIEIDCLDESQ
jgi:hypothetical protein